MAKLSGVPHVIPHRIHINGGDTGEIQLRVRGAAGQTANILEVQNSAGTSLFTVDNDGDVSIAGNLDAVVNETLTGNIILSGNLTVNGNTVLGNAAADTLTVNATSTFATSVTFSSTSTFNGTARFNVPTSATAHYLRRQTPAPSANNDNGAIYTSTGDAGTTELWYLDAAGNTVQITDSGALEGSSLFWDDDEYIRMGNTAASPDVRLGWNTTQTVDAWYFGTADGQNTLIIAENGDRTFDFAHGAQTNPTLFIQSAAQSATQWLSLAHDQTNTVLTSGAGALVVNATAFLPDANDAYALGAAGTAFSDLFLAEGAVINWDSSDATITQTGDTLAFGGSTLIDIQAGILELNDAVRFDTGVAMVAASYSVGRDADGTNQMHFNVPTGAGWEWSVNDVSLITSTAIAPLTITQVAGTSGVPTAFTVTGAAHTGLTAATEDIGANFNFSATKTWAAGAGPLALQREINIQAPTYVGNAGGALTITRADTVSITGAPTAGASMTLSEANALYVGGQMRLDSQLRWGAGVAVTAGQYSVGRDADGTNQLHFNVPTGATFEWSINDVALSVWDFAAASGDIDAAYQLTFVAQDSSHNNYPTLLVGEASTYGIGIQANNQTYDIPTIQLGYSNSGGALDMWNYRSWQATNTYDMIFTTKGSGNSATTRLTITGNAAASTVTVSNSNVVFTPIAGTTGTPTALTVTGAAHTGLTAATEDIGANFNFSATKTWAAGAGPLATQREVLIQAPTYVGDAGGALSINDAYTFYVSGGPTQGANMTLVRTWAAGFNGNIGVGNGTAALPSISFISDSNTGIYLGGTDRLSLVAGGTELIKVETDRISITGSDGVTITQRNQNTPETLLTLAPYAVGSSDASVERTDFTVQAVTRTFGTGALTNQRFNIFDGASIAFVGPSLVTNYANVFIDTPNTLTNATVTTLNALQVGGAATINQVAGTLYGAIGIPAHTITLGNTTNITSVGFGALNLGQITVTQAGAANTLATAATIYAANAPVGGGSTTITAPYVAWFDDGVFRNDGIFQQNDAIYFTQTDGNEKIDSAADGYLDYTVTTAHRFNMATADTDVRLEFLGTTSSGLLEWMEDEDYFRFSDSIFMVRGIIGKQGSDIASASTIAIPTDGNTFELTGVTAVNLITSTGFQDGFTITLVANENVTINHATATSGANITILLSGAGNFAMTANDTLTLVLSSTTAGGQAWREVARTAI